MDNTQPEIEDRGDVIAEEALVDEAKAEPAAEAKPAEPTAEPTAAKTDSKPDNRIPFERFQQVNERAKRAEQELQQTRMQMEYMRGKSEAGNTSDAAPTLTDLRKQSVAALQAGDVDKYEALQAKIEAAIVDNVTHQTTKRVYEQVMSEQQTNALIEAATHIATTHPELNSESPQFDAQKQSEVIDWRDLYISKGYAPDKALRMAADKVMPKTVSPAIIDPRPAAALTRGLTDAKAQPPAGVKVGERSASAFDIERATDKEFKSIDAKELARMRGDFIS